jgi:ferredoxin-NADP reductase
VSDKAIRQIDDKLQDLNNNDGIDRCGCTLNPQSSPSKLESLEIRSYTSNLLSRGQVARGTQSFEFERPAGFSFKAGQFIDLILPGILPDGSDELVHTFSIASPPSFEKIMIAARMRDTAFKRPLSSLPIGAKVRIKGPMGNFTLHKNTMRPAVFLAGGIGVVPFLSILSDLSVDRRKTPISLFYANRLLEDAAFLHRIWEIERGANDFRFIPTLTRVGSSNTSWRGETGRITAEMLGRHPCHLQGAICYVAGPPEMVRSSRMALNAAGVDDDDIRTEEFCGY